MSSCLRLVRLHIARRLLALIIAILFNVLYRYLVLRHLDHFDVDRGAHGHKIPFGIRRQALFFALFIVQIIGFFFFIIDIIFVGHTMSPLADLQHALLNRLLQVVFRIGDIRELILLYLRQFALQFFIIVFNRMAATGVKFELIRALPNCPL